MSDDHGQGETTAGLQGPTGYAGIYADWNVDLDDDGAGDDPWRFGTAAQYPVLAADVDGDGQATWEEFGRQLREGPTLTATPGQDGVALTWTAVDASHWSPPPAVTYTVARDDATVAEGRAGLGYDDAGATPEQAHTYQVAASVSGGEATRSGIERVNADDDGTSAADAVAWSEFDLANDLAGLVAYPVPVVAGKPKLRAAFEDVPESHDGETAFEFGVTFTEEPRLSVAVMSDYAFEIAGGDILQATRMGHGSDWQWAITVEPNSVAPVTIKLPATTDCEAMGAVCTEDGRPLSNGVRSHGGGSAADRRLGGRCRAGADLAHTAGWFCRAGWCGLRGACRRVDATGRVGVAADAWDGTGIVPGGTPRRGGACGLPRIGDASAARCGRRARTGVGRFGSCPT